MTHLNSPWLNSEHMVTLVTEVAKQPMTIAMVASIGAHGLFLLGLPAITASQPKDNTRTVGVVALTPEEMAQLPSTNSTMMMPQGNPLSPLPPTGNSFSFPQQPNTTPPQPDNLLGSTGGIGTDPNSIYSLPNLGISSGGMDFSNAFPPRSSSNSVSDRDRPSATDNQPKNIQQSEVQISHDDASQEDKSQNDSQKTPPNTPPSPLTSANPTQQQIAANQTPNNNPPAGANPSGPTPLPPDGGPTVPARMSSATEELLKKQQEYQRIAASYKADGAKDKQGELTRAGGLFLSTLKPEVLTKYVEANGGTFPKIAEPTFERHNTPLIYPFPATYKLPNFQFDQPVKVSGLVGADGKLDPETLYVLKGTGYDDLDAIAIEEMKTKQFPATGQLTYRIVEFYFAPRQQVG
ncbi:hypothetical protein [Alkalinema sp. FACHB-956]|uniref:hypothetical protein n=1 Tax=Alkalinema sp. FACHB-956 TaxID=2692768 RepID=UPI001686D5C3|nr:hypothetical protein [Alkalinema sp. FACHB-956]MBD2328106.1 hypothetical protein [Alkalinema sp. FACHB-956]